MRAYCVAKMHDYATALLIGQLESQRENCTKMLCDLFKRESELSQHFADGEEFWTASENAKLVADAEEYYRKSFSGGVVTWKYVHSTSLRGGLLLLIDRVVLLDVVQHPRYAHAQHTQFDSATLRRKET
jgi:hypothetical protein